MIAAKCKKCGYIGCNGDNSLCNNGDRFIYTGLEEYLKGIFTPCDCYTFKSNKKRLGAGTGDDSILYIYADTSSTSIWWREVTGFEKTIFEGRKLKSIQELETVFDLLDLKDIL